MLVTYPALFYFDSSAEEGFYFVHFPDFENSATQGEDTSDAMMMAADYLGLMISDLIENNQAIPKPTNINELSLIENDPFKEDSDIDLIFDEEKSFISMVTVDVTNYLGDMEPIKKTLTIPRWADRLGKELHLNFSKTLTDAIAEKRLKV